MNAILKQCSVSSVTMWTLFTAGLVVSDSLVWAADEQYFTVFQQIVATNRHDQTIPFPLLEDTNNTALKTINAYCSFDGLKTGADVGSVRLGTRSTADIYSGVTGHAYFCQGKPCAGLEGWAQGWKVEADCLVNTGAVAQINPKTRFGKEDLAVSASLSLDELKGTEAAFTFGDRYAFEFDPTDQRFVVTGLPLIRSRVVLPTSVITPGKQFAFSAEHRGDQLDFFIDDKLVQTVRYDGEMGSVGFAPKKGVMHLRSFGASQMWTWPPAGPPQTNAPRTFSLRHIQASEMADGLRQILLGRFGMEARPAPDNIQLTVTAPPDVLNRVTTFVAVNDWPERIIRDNDSFYPRDQVERAARSFFYACSIEDSKGVARMLSPSLLAKLKGIDAPEYPLMPGFVKDEDLIRQLRADWEGKDAAVRKLLKAWNRFPLLHLRARPYFSVSFGERWWVIGAFEKVPEDFVTLSFIRDHTGGTNRPLMIETLPPWFTDM